MAFANILRSALGGYAGRRGLGMFGRRRGMGFGGMRGRRGIGRGGGLFSMVAAGFGLYRMYRSRQHRNAPVAPRG